MNTTPAKLCKDCKHFLPYPSVADYARVSLATCARSATILNLIDGTNRHRFCENERSNEAACGVQGRHFEPDNCDVLP
jgi:hypothetical protein